MRNALLLPLAFLSIPLMAQNTGKAVYTESIKIEIKLEGPQAERMKGRIPRERKSKKELIFSEEASLYQNAEIEVGEQEQNMHFTTQEGANIKIEYARPDNKTHIAIKEQILTEKREFMGKNFLIKEDLSERKWKITGEQKQIGEYLCMQAIMGWEEKQVEAWFTPQIPVSAGPDIFTGLPGLIVYISVDQGKRVIELDSIELTDVDGKILKAPKGGKEVTREEFRELVKEKMKENGGNERVIIRTMH